MFESLKNWWMDRFVADDEPVAPRVRRTGSFPAQSRPHAKAQQSRPQLSDEDQLNGKIESLGRGKNVLIRNKIVREDTGTHETLKILDDSLVDSGEETGIDPYNTGQFDRSRHWDTRFRK
ncbi:MAG: hypothetical protein AAFN50_03075 [Pseudomonadota bacterium]